MQRSHRIFIAINLPEEVKRQLFKYSQKWPELQGKWTAKDNLHITLQFLGNLTDEELGDVCLAVKKVVESHGSFSLSINQIIYGPPGKIPPRMIWAVGDKSEELAELRKDLEKELLQKVSFIPETRGLAPHITLARLNSFALRHINQDEIPEINEGLDVLFSVESLEVMESELKKGGPQYTILESHVLK